MIVNYTSMSVTCMLCPPITFNGDIYIGCVPWFPEGVSVKWSPEIAFRIKTLESLEEDIDILEGVYNGNIQKPYRDSWDKVFTLHYNPNPKGKVLFHKHVYVSYIEKGKYIHYPQFNDLYLVINDEISITTPPAVFTPLRIYCSPFDLVLQNMTGGSSRIKRKRTYKKNVLIKNGVIKENHEEKVSLVRNYLDKITECTLQIISVNVFRCITIRFNMTLSTTSITNYIKTLFI